MAQRIKNAVRQIEQGQSWVRICHSSCGFTERPKVLVCGSFNPLHDGHRQMASMASSRLRQPVDYELSIQNADKPGLDASKLIRRLIDPQMTFEAAALRFSPHGLVLSAAANFANKSTIFPESIFVVGVDTIVRVADPRFYENQTSQRDQAMAVIRDHGCRFLVFGRLVGHSVPTQPAINAVHGDHKNEIFHQSTKSFKTLADINLPRSLALICEGVSEREFRCDISSTDLRQDE